jgi:hypothetical protein
MSDETQSKLNEGLRKAAVNGWAAVVIAFLQEGAEIDGVNDKKRTALMSAAYNGNKDVVEILLAAGADTTLRDSINETAEDDARNEGHPEVVALLQGHERGESLSPDKVVFQSKLDNRTLEEVFNFVTRERILLVRKSPKGAVEALTCMGFSMIEDQSDQSQLRKAFNEHVRRGGTADEALVFPNKLLKNKLPRGG